MMKANDSDHCSPQHAAYHDDVEQARAPPEQWQPSTTAGSYLVNNNNNHGNGCLLPSSEEYKVDHPVRTVRTPPRRSHRRRGRAAAAAVRHHHNNDNVLVVDDEHDLHREYEQQVRGSMSGFWNVVCTVTLIITLVILLPVLLVRPKQDEDLKKSSSTDDENLPWRPNEDHTPSPTTTTTTQVPVPTLPSSSNSPSVTDNFQAVTNEEPLTLFRVHAVALQGSVLSVRLLVPPPQLDVDDELRILSAANKYVETGEDCSNTDDTTTSMFTVEHVVTAENFDSTTAIVDIYNSEDTTLAICANNVIVGVAHHLFIKQGLSPGGDAVSEMLVGLW